MSLLDTASLIVTPNGFKASKLYSVIPSTGAGDMDVTRATTATRVNSLGLIESVANNVPRLDYTDGSCPSILVEPQRTNNILYSEQFDNAAWVKLGIGGGSAPVVTANSTTAPDGNLTADKIVFNAPTSGDISIIKQSISLVGTANGSIYVKAFSSGDVGKIIGFRFNADTYGLITLTDSWQRFNITQIALESFEMHLRPAIGTSSGTVSAYVWGAQLEAGSYATSYIPTVASTVTRNADVISKTGISSLIGQTEGTLFVEEVYDASIANNGGLDDTLVSLTDGTSSNLISIFHYGLGIGNVLFFIRLSGATQVAISTSTPTSGTYKIALAYKNNDVVGYINGVQIGTDTSATIPATSAITLVDPITTNAATKTVKRKNVAVWKTRLTNAELATLTTL